MSSEVSALVAALKATEERALVAEAKLATAQAKLKAPRKHTFGVTNPLLFPASLHNKQLVSINQPFVSFLRKPPAADRFRKRRLPDSVLQHALKQALLRPMVSTELLCKSRTGELTQWHLSLLQGYRALAKVSPEAARRVHEAEVDAGIVSDEEAEMEEEMEQVEACFPEEDDEADDKDMSLADVKGEEEEVEEENEEEEEEEEFSESGRSSGSSQRFIDLAHEANKKDFCIKVLDSLIYKKQIDAWVTVLVIKCKEPLKENGIWQAVKQAIREGLINIEKGRVAPIHVMQWSSGSWSYGVVDVYGSLQIVRGTISADSYKEFERQQKVRWLYGGKKGGKFELDARFTEDVLEKQLLERKQMLRRNCSSNRNVDYPDGTYLVGTVYVSTKKCDLPNAINLGRIGALDTDRFYEGLLKIIVGNKAETWTVGDVDAAIRARDDEVTRIVEAATNHLSNKRQKVR